MIQTSLAVQQALCKALLAMLRSPDLTQQEARWVRQFAMRTIAEFNLRQSNRKDDTPKEPIAA